MYLTQWHYPQPKLITMMDILLLWQIVILEWMFDFWIGRDPWNRHEAYIIIYFDSVSAVAMENLYKILSILGIYYVDTIMLEKE
jgi:hypothetical protein